MNTLIPKYRTLRLIESNLDLDPRDYTRMTEKGRGSFLILKS